MDRTLTAGSIVELTIERPVSGGRMLARLDRQVILVAGAIPGERVRARIEPTLRGVTFATVHEILEPSPARRPATDPGCGGHAYAHIAYAEHPALKRAVVLDALAHGGRIKWPAELRVHASPERGYRLRARLRVVDGRVGYFREGTHELCDAAISGQLLEATTEAIDHFLATMPATVAPLLQAIDVTENLAGEERVVHLSWADRTRPGSEWFAPSLATGGITGVSMTAPASGLPMTVAGIPSVGDDVAALLAEAADLSPHVTRADGQLRRHAPAFFQANRYLLPRLVAAVARHVGHGPIVDLYAGVGLFAITLAALGKGPITAIEGDPVSGADLSANAARFDDILVERGAVETFAARLRLPPDATIVVDPPRTGVSRAALDGVLAARAGRLVYVSCDVATLARDLRRAIDAGYTLVHLEAFDLFPNTAHVESLAVLDRR